MKPFDREAAHTEAREAAWRALDDDTAQENDVDDDRVNVDEVDATVKRVALRTSLSSRKRQSLMRRRGRKPRSSCPASIN
jgi:hypothetical protein